MPVSPSEFGKGLPPPRSMSVDRPCASCGYNLRGLKVGGRCPECGEEIPPPPTLDDDSLSRMPRPVIRAFIRGAVTAAGSIILLVVAALAVLFGWMSVHLLGGVVGVALLGWMLAMWWLTPALTIREGVSRGFSRRGVTRHIARWGQLGWLLGAGVLLAREVASPAQKVADGMTWAAFGLGAIGVIGTIAMAVMMERLAEWTRDATAETIFQWFQWLLPFAAIGLLLLPTGSIWGRLAGLIGAAAVLAFPIGVLMLAGSVWLSGVHHLEHTARETRRYRRLRAHLNAISARSMAADGGQPPPSGKPVPPRRRG